MNNPTAIKSANRMDLTLELRSANGSSTEFYQDDEKRVNEALRILSSPRLFAQPHLLLASQRSASMIPSKGIDMILAHTSVRTPLKFPLNLPAGLFDIAEQPDAWPDNPSAETEDQDGQLYADMLQRNAQVEVHTFGGWTVTLKAVARFRGNVQDERNWFAQLREVPTIPFRLANGGFGLINTANIMRASTWPKPEALPGIALPLVLRRRIPARI